MLQIHSWCQFELKIGTSKKYFKQTKHLHKFYMSGVFKYLNFSALKLKILNI